LLSLQWFLDGATLNNLNCVLVDAMLLYGDLTHEAIVAKKIIFGAKEVYVFQVMA
jgi:hypothetical protein